MAWRGQAGLGRVGHGLARQGMGLIAGNRAAKNRLMTCNQAGRGAVRRGWARRGAAWRGMAWQGMATIFRFNVGT